MAKYAIGFIGAGKMAEGIVSAMASRETVVMAEKDGDRRRFMAERYGVETVPDAKEAIGKADIAFLAVRPQDVAGVAAELGALPSGKTLVSIAAGKKLETLRGLFGEACGLVRVMPNLALRARAGMCAICAAPGTPPAHLEAVREILSAAGETTVLEERHFDAVTALGGSGPAYFAYMQKSMAEAGRALGLDKASADLIAAQTMFGTAKYLRESGADLEKFIEGVCTKGGTTEAGMRRLAAGAFDEAVRETIAAAAARSAELG